MDYWWKQAAQAAKAAAQAVARQRGDEEPNYQVRSLLEVLRKARNKYSEATPNRLYFALAVFGLVFPVASQAIFSTAMPLIGWVGIIVLVSIVDVLLALWIKECTRRWKAQFPAALAQSAMIEKLVLGWEQLPDIYRYTYWPWKLFLGAKPRTLQEQVKLVAANIDWFLLEEPRALVRIQWITSAVVVGWQLMQLTFLLLHSTQLVNSTTFFPMIYMVMVIYFLMLPLMVIDMFQRLRLRYAVEALYEHCVSRFASSDDGISAAGED